MLDGQIFHNNSFSYPHLWHIGPIKVQIPPADLDVLLLHSSSQPSPLEQALPVLAAAELLVSLAKLGVVAIVVIMPLDCSTLEPKSYCSTFLLSILPPIPVQHYHPIISLFNKTGLSFGLHKPSTYDPVHISSKLLY